jgi:hypothetical protein
VYITSTIAGDIYKQPTGTGDFIALKQPNRNYSNVVINNLTNDVYVNEQGGDLFIQYGGQGDFIPFGLSGINYLSMYINQLTNDIFACGDKIYEQIYTLVSADLSTADNSIKIIVPTGGSEVEYLEIAYNVDGDSNGWYLLDKIKKDSQELLLATYFYNNQSNASVILSDIEKPFDNIPIHSDDCGMLPATYLSLSGNQMYEDTTQIEADALISANPINKINRFVYTKTITHTFEPTYNQITEYSSIGNEFTAQKTATFDWTAIYDALVDRIANCLTISIFDTESNFYYNKTILLSPDQYTNPFLAISQFLALEFSDFGILHNDSVFYFNQCENTDLYSFTEINILLENNTIDFTGTENSKETFSGAGNFGIVYSDKNGRNVGIKTLDELKVNSTPSISASPNNGILPNIATITISNKPDPTAYSFQIYYTGNLNEGQKWMDLFYINKDVNGTYLTTYDTTKYLFEKGDYINVLGDLESGVLTSMLQLTYQLDGAKDASSLIKIYINGAKELSVGSIYLIEIIRPIKKSDTLYFECSPVFKIVNGLHQGNIRCQDDNNDCIILLSGGDCFNRLYNNNLVIESFSPSNLYPIQAWGNGRISVPVQQTNGGFLNNTLLSGKYVPNTQMNGTSTFDWQESSNEVNEKYGKITRTILVGDVFNVIQKNKISDYYIGRDIAQKEGLMVVIDSVLGKIRESEFSYGSMHPDSIKQNNGYVYGYDCNRKCIWRKASNGITDTSSLYKISFLLEEISNKVLADINRYEVVSYVNPLINMVYFTFRDTSQGQEHYTIGFLEGADKWVSFYSFIPDIYAGLTDMVSFKNGQIYVHSDIDNVGQLVPRCNYYGRQYPSQFKIIGNDSMPFNKVWDCLLIDSNKRWDIIADIDPTENTKNGMHTEIKGAQLVVKEGKYFISFPRNMKSRQKQSIIDQLFTGDKMRGQVIEILFTNNETTESWVSNIEINATKSI